MKGNARSGNNGLWSSGGPGFSSKTDLWATPPHVFAALDAEFGFELDVCAATENAKCARFFSAEEDGLAQTWAGTVWMNPPYGRGISAWMRKAADSADAGATVVALVPARPDTKWWHEQVMARAAEVRLVRGRLAFGNGDSPAPFPSAVVVYRPGERGPVFTTWTPPRSQHSTSRSKKAGHTSEQPSPSGTSAATGQAQRARTSRGRYRKAGRMLEAGEHRAEAELLAYLAREMEAGTLDPVDLYDHASRVAYEIANETDNGSLVLLNEVLQVVFDPRAVDPDLLAEDPEAVYLEQIMLGYQDHLDAHLEEFAAATSFFARGVSD